MLSFLDSNFFFFLTGVVIEEINDEDETASSSDCKNSSTQNSVAQSHEIRDSSKSERVVRNGGSSTNLEHLQALRNDPEAIRFIYFSLES